VCGVSPSTLDELVTAVASRLMAVNAASMRTVSEAVLRELVDYLAVDLSFLRFHDLERRTTSLVAEWPRRPTVPDPDPLGVIFFASADPVIAASEHLAEAMLIRPDRESEGYQRRVQEGAGVPATSAATVPLRSGDVTTGILGFIKYGDRGWEPAEINALTAIAALLAQLQARLLAEEQLRHLAHHDALTGLPNRRALLDHLDSRAAPGRPGPVAMLFLDVDRLKALNDFLGHQAGDQFIASVATRLREHVRPDDFVARLGGDEFVIVLAGTSDTAQAVSVALRTQQALNEPTPVGGQTLSRTVSIGVALAQPGRDVVSEWLRNADQAALGAKTHGGNRVVAFTEEMEAQNDVRNDIELHLRAAIGDGSLLMHYQPTVDLRTRQLLGAEALVRWHHPTLGLLPPDSFIGVAEATNLAGELGHWVLHEACRQLAAWQSETPTLAFHLAVNVSPVQLITTGFVPTVAEALSEHGIKGADLTLEITEHAVVGDLGTVLTTLRGLRELDVQVAIDDFGTGYSSLAQLKALPVNTLKIDQGFVRELGTNPDDLAIVRSIIGLAASFGLNLIAEGVETEIAAQTLLRLGCHQAQGYLFSPPIPATQMRELLAPPRTEDIPPRTTTTDVQPEFPFHDQRPKLPGDNNINTGMSPAPTTGSETLPRDDFPNAMTCGLPSSS